MPNYIDKDGNIIPLFFKGQQGDKGDKGDKGEDGNVLQQEAIDKINSSLAENVNKLNTLYTEKKNVIDYGIVGDGITDNTIKIQELLNSGGNIVFPKGTYYFKNILCNTSNVNIEFLEGCILKSDSQGSTLLDGAIKFKGTEGAFLTIVSEDIKEGQNYIKVIDSSMFNVDDSIRIEQSNPVGVTFEDNLRKYIVAIMTIKSIDKTNNTIYFNEAIPHSFYLENSVGVRKISPITNIKITGNGTIFDKMGTTDYTSHFVFDYCNNVYISDINFVNGGGKGIVFSNTHTFYTDRIKHSTPTNVTEGHGYGIQATQGSCFGVIANSELKASRHGVDFSYGANNIKVNGGVFSNCGINGHGQNTKYIEINSCVMYGVGVGLGNFSFMSDNNYVLTNVITYNCPYSFNIANKTFNVDINNCKSVGSTESTILMTGATNVNIINFEDVNCKKFGIKSEQGTSNVNITNIKARGNTITSAPYIFVNEDSDISSVDKADIETSNIRIIEFVSTDTSKQSKCKISNALNLKSNHTTSEPQSVKSSKGGLEIDNCVLNSHVLIFGVDSIKFTRNRFNNIKIDIRATKNSITKDNLGSAILWNVPVNNDTNVITKDNITSLI